MENSCVQPSTTPLYSIAIPCSYGRIMKCNPPRTSGPRRLIRRRIGGCLVHLRDPVQDVTPYAPSSSMATRPFLEGPRLLTLSLLALTRLNVRAPASSVRRARDSE